MPSTNRNCLAFTIVKNLKHRLLLGAAAFAGILLFLTASAPPTILCRSWISFRR